MESKGNCRTLNEVVTVAEYAKLDLNELNNTVQTLSFSTELNSDEIQLIELDKDTLEQLQSGQRLVLRGEKSESAVLCSKNTTYEIKDAETSNSLLILPECSIPDELTNAERNLVKREVCAVLHTYYELRKCKPRLKKLKDVLEENVFSGYECEEDDEHQGQKYRRNDLLELVQASEDEINEGIHKLQGFELDGYIRLLNFEYLMNVINHLTQLIDENSWACDHIPLQDCVNTLHEIIPDQITQHVLECYSDRNDERAEEGIVYKLNEDKICKLYAEMILRYTDKFNLVEFLDAWQQSVLPGMTTSLSQLEGMVLVDRSSKPEIIKYFPVSELSDDHDERFNMLFKTREKWTLAEITPFIQDLASEKVNVGGLLLKYARASMQGGVKVYNSKRPVT